MVEEKDLLIICPICLHIITERNLETQLECITCGSEIIQVYMMDINNTESFQTVNAKKVFK